MKMMDCVELTVEKAEYSKDGVHKGMQGWICLDDNRNGTWLVNFPQYGEKEDIAELAIKEEDLNTENILPKAFDRSVAINVAEAVKEAARRTNVARI